MAPPLDPPPNMPTIVWPKLKDWLYKLWKLVTTAVNQLAGLTFGDDAATYSSAVFSTIGQTDPVSLSYIGPGFLGGASVVLAAVNTSGFSVAASADSTITGWTASIDTGKGLTSSSTYTVQEPGFYLSILNILYTNQIYGAGGYGACRIALNGTQVSNGLNQTGTAGTASVYVNTNTQILMQCKAGDLITTLANQVWNGASANTLYSGGLYNNWTIIKL